ncbi:NUDIX hydrolase [Candidatus Micrarchaeota archaeon]|nr:NUDIX hydrolase [Candidatus Micrarchaeota archaeon]
MPSRKTAGVILYYLHEGHPHIVTFRRKEGMEGAGTWVIGPGGHRKAGEKPKETAIRETSEETQKTFGKKQLVKLSTWYGSGRKHYTFLGKISREEAEELIQNAKDPEHKEFDDAGAHPLEELMAKVDAHLDYKKRGTGEPPEKLFFFSGACKKNT